MNTAFVKIHRSCDEGVDSWIHIIDAATKEVIGEGRTIMDAYVGVEQMGYQIMCRDRAAEEVKGNCHE